MSRKANSAREIFFFHNTLTGLVKALEGHATTIDLRDDSSVTGKLETVDGMMNINISDAVYCNSRGDEYIFDSFFIQARNIRYVHVPQQMPIVPTIKGYLENLQSRPEQRVRDQERKNMLESRKYSKAKRQHMQTVASLHT